MVTKNYWVITGKWLSHTHTHTHTHTQKHTHTHKHTHTAAGWSAVIKSHIDRTQQPISPVPVVVRYSIIVLALSFYSPVLTHTPTPLPTPPNTHTHTHTHTPLFTPSLALSVSRVSIAALFLGKLLMYNSQLPHLGRGRDHFKSHHGLVWRMCVCVCVCVAAAAIDLSGQLSVFSNIRLISGLIVNLSPPLLP